MIDNQNDSSFESAQGVGAVASGVGNAVPDAGQMHSPKLSTTAARAATSTESSAHLFDSDEDDDFIRGGTSGPQPGALPSLPGGSMPVATAGRSASRPRHSSRHRGGESTDRINVNQGSPASGASLAPPFPPPQPPQSPPAQNSARGGRKPQRVTAAATARRSTPSSSSAAAEAHHAVRLAEAAAAASAVHQLMASVVVLVENLPRQYQKQLDKLQGALGDDVMRVTHTWSPGVTHCIVPVKAVPDPRGGPVLTDEGGGKRRRSGGQGAVQALVARRRSDAYLLSLAHGAELVTPAWISAGVAEKPYVLVAEAPYRLAGDEESLKSAVTASALLNAGPPAALRTVAAGTPRPLQGWSVAMCGLFQYPIPIEKNTATLLQAMGALVLLPLSDISAFGAFVGAACSALATAEEGSSWGKASQPGLVLLLDDSKDPCAIPKFLETAVKTKTVAQFGGPVYAPSVRWLLDVICSYTALDPNLQEFQAVHRVTAASAAQHT